MNNLFAFLRRTNPVQSNGSISIQGHTVYILPTGFGLFFASLLIVLLVGSINYANNLGFLLTFFLAAIGLMAMVHTWRNLVGLHLKPLRVEPIFSGQTAQFLWQLESERLRPGIYLSNETAHQAAFGDVDIDLDVKLSLEITINRRGFYSLQPCTLSTRYPLSLFRAWSYVESGSRCLVYPEPINWHAISINESDQEISSQSAKKDLSGTDFHELRQYRPGDPIRNIHWPSLARGNDLMSREFEVPINDEFWLDWNDVPGPGSEQRLSQLCFSVLEASRKELRFGLRLPGVTVEPASSDLHSASCLRHLALYGLEDK